MSAFIGDWHALVVLLVAGFLPNEVWRMVATAILAGVIAQILVVPPGALATIPAELRYGAVAVGLVVFMLTKRSIFLGVATGELVMVAGKYWLG
jgi:hypothetical protein